jgi:hypothetical protein
MCTSTGYEPIVGQMTASTLKNHGFQMFRDPRGEAARTYLGGC